VTDADRPEPPTPLLESLPDALVAALEVRDAWRRRVAEESPAFEFIVADLSRWPLGTPVRVAFLDGPDTLHGEVADATTQITDACGLELDFGHDPSTGTYRRWHETDTEHAADIRVSFDRPGYWSLVGTDSTDPTIAPPSLDVGGLPHQRSLNLGGFTTNRPADWKGTVRHEFMHAVAFKHEHQNMRGPCQDEFRWDDDPGYVPTQDAGGAFVPDGQGRRPGIYTYLAGAPNFWSRSKVDHNLRTVESTTSVAGPFDRASVMLYRFAPFFYKSNPSTCAPDGDGEDLSDGDRRGLQLLYPRTVEESVSLTANAEVAIDELRGIAAGLESTGAAPSPFEERVVTLLEQHAHA
jgi:hypothetical protein